MGREIRRVPPNWEHPRGERGRFTPLMDSPFDTAMDEWNTARAEWNAPGNAERAEQEKTAGHPVPFEEWHGGPPDPETHRPAWPEGSATAYQVYETVSEGTPVSPVFATREALVEWLVNDGSGMGIGGVPQRLSRKAAEAFVNAAWAPSAIGLEGQGLYSGVTMYEREPGPPKGSPE